MVCVGFPQRLCTSLYRYATHRTVVTYDPRGADRSPRTDDAAESTPDEHADDLHRLIAAQVRPGREPVLAASVDIHETYQRSGSCTRSSPADGRTAWAQPYAS